jgi:hypothetical protein
MTNNFLDIGKICWQSGKGALIIYIYRHVKEPVVIPSLLNIKESRMPGEKYQAFTNILAIMLPRPDDTKK